MENRAPGDNSILFKHVLPFVKGPRIQDLSRMAKGLSQLFACAPACLFLFCPQSLAPKEKTCLIAGIVCWLELQGVSSRCRWQRQPRGPSSHPHLRSEERRVGKEGRS